MGCVIVDIHNFVATMVSTVFFEVLLRSGFFLLGHLVPMIVGYANGYSQEKDDAAEKYDDVLVLWLF